MGSKLNKSFVWGIFVASITWTISLYLFWSLMKTQVQPDSSKTKMSFGKVSQNEKKDWWALGKDSRSSFFNKLNGKVGRSDLQPVYPTVNG